jgi:glycosyltransferase involved in cell wall biosynthesis
MTKRLRETCVPLDGVVIISVGNNAWYKNRDGILRVFNNVVARYEGRQPTLVVAGAGLAASQMATLHRNGLSGAVISLGAVSSDVLEALYRRADVCLFPSIYEGFGWPPLEAQCCGCPVVASTGGSLREILGESALLAAPNDHESLADHVLRILEDHDLREGLIARGYENIKRFSAEKMVDEYLEVYEEILRDQAKPGNLKE